MKESLTKCEEKIMDIIWESDVELNLPGIVERVNRKYGTDWKPQTISTFLTRLRKKKVVEVYRAGRTFFYQPLVSRDAYVRKITVELCEMWFGGDADKLYEIAKNIKNR